MAGQFHHGSKKDFLSTCAANHDGYFGITALLNQENGTFKVIDDTAAENACQQPLLAADLNGDGLTDVIMISCTVLWPSTTFGVQLSNSAGDGTFTAPVYYTAKNLNPDANITSVVLGDFEGNGRMDLAMITVLYDSSSSSETEAALTIFLNNGSGAFTQVATYPLKSTSESVPAPFLVAGDLNGDHKTDLAVIYPTNTAGTLVPFISEGSGKFRQGGTYNTGANPRSAVIGKFNGDAYGDIAITTSAGVKVLLGNSSAIIAIARDEVHCARRMLKQ